MLTIAANITKDPSILRLEDVIQFYGPDIYPSTGHFGFWITTVLIVLIVYNNFLPTILPKSFKYL